VTGEFVSDVSDVVSDASDVLICRDEFNVSEVFCCVW